MASKYSQRSIGVGCTGACGYLGAKANPIGGQTTNQLVKIQAPIAHIPQTAQNQNVKIQAPISHIPVKIWTWDSIVPGKTYTYLDAYTQMMFYLGFPIDMLTSIQNAIQSLWSTPSDVTKEYAAYYNQNDQYNNFWFPEQNSDGSPSIPDPSDTLFWNWVENNIGSLWYRLKPVMGASWSDTPGSGTYSSWTYLDVYMQMLLNTGLNNNMFNSVKNNLQHTWVGPYALIGEYVKLYPTQTQGWFNTFTVPFLPQQGDSFWGWLLTKLTTINPTSVNSSNVDSGSVGATPQQQHRQNLNQQFNRIQQQYRPIQNINFWTWDSIIPRSQFTYAQYYNSVISQKCTNNPSVQPTLIQNRWSTPSDVTKEYAAYYNQNNQHNNFWFPEQNSDGSPSIPNQSDMAFWFWVGVQLGYNCSYNVYG